MMKDSIEAAQANWPTQEEHNQRMNKQHIEQIRIDRDPRLAVKEGHDAIEFALMHPSHFSRRHVAELEYARQVIARVMGEL